MAVRDEKWQGWLHLEIACSLIVKSKLAGSRSQAAGETRPPAASPGSHQADAGQAALAGREERYGCRIKGSEYGVCILSVPESPGSHHTHRTSLYRFGNAEDTYTVLTALYPAPVEGASRRALEPGKRGPDLVVRVGLTLVKQRWPGERMLDRGSAFLRCGKKALRCRASRACSSSSQASRDCSHAASEESGAAIKHIVGAK
jgi:hypothetical protein